MYKKNAKHRHIAMYERWGFIVTPLYPSGGSLLLNLTVVKGRPVTPEHKALVVTL